MTNQRSKLKILGEELTVRRRADSSKEENNRKEGHAQPSVRANHAYEIKKMA